MYGANVGVPSVPSVPFLHYQGFRRGQKRGRKGTGVNSNKGNRKMLDDTSANLSGLRPTDEIMRGTASNVSSSAPLPGPEAPDEAQAPPVRKLSERWYVIRHKPFEGFRARNAIRRLGYEVHWPRLIVRQPRRNDVIEPLFPGYLFARFDRLRDSWGKIRDIDAVVGVLGADNGGSPAAVPTDEVLWLIIRAGAIDAAIDETGDDDAPHVVDRMDEGSEVSFLDRELFRQPALLKADRGGERVKIMQAWFGEVREVSVRRDRVRA